MPRVEIERSLERRDTTEHGGRPRAERLGHLRAVQRLEVIGRQFLSPITAILVVAALVAIATGDLVDGSIRPREEIALAEGDVIPPEAACC